MIYDNLQYKILSYFGFSLECSSSSAETSISSDASNSCKPNIQNIVYVSVRLAYRHYVTTPIPMAN